MKSSSRKIEKTLAWIANIIVISVVVLMYTGFFDRPLEGVFLTPEFVRFTSSSIVETFILYTRIEYYRAIEIFIILIKFSVLLTALIALLATFKMKYRIFSGVLFLFLAFMIADRNCVSCLLIVFYCCYYVIC